MEYIIIYWEKKNDDDATDTEHTRTRNTKHGGLVGDDCKWKWSIDDGSGIIIIIIQAAYTHTHTPLTYARTLHTHPYTRERTHATRARTKRWYASRSIIADLSLMGPVVVVARANAGTPLAYVKTATAISIIIVPHLSPRCGVYLFND